MKRFFSSFLIIATLLGFSSWAYSEGMTGGGPGMTGQSGFQSIYRSNEYRLMDTDRTHYLRIIAGSDLTANRLLTLTTGDAARTITLSGNPTLADWFDQAVKTSSTPIFPTIYGSNEASGTLTLTSTSHGTKGNISIGRLTLSDLANSDGIVFGSLGTATKAIDLSGSNLSGDTDYQIYIGASDYWSASGKVVFTGPFSIGSTDAVLGSPGAKVGIYSSSGVNAALVLKGTNVDDANFASLYLMSDEATDKIWQITHRATVADINKFLWQYYNGSTWIVPMAIDTVGHVGFNETAPIYTVDVDGAINSQKYYWVEEFDDEVSGVQFESGLQADFWTTAGTNYAAGNVTYLAGVGGTLKVMAAAADNDSVTSLGVLNANVTQNPIMEVRVKIDTKETAAFYVGFASAAFADVNGAFPADAFLVGINSDNGHGLGATQIVAASVDAGAAVDYDDMGVAIVSDTYVKIKIDLTDTEQPRVWINDTEVAAGSISGTVQTGVALAPYFMVQNLAGGAIQRFITLDYAKTWQDRG